MERKKGFQRSAQILSKYETGEYNCESSYNFSSKNFRGVLQLSPHKKFHLKAFYNYLLVINPKMEFFVLEH